MASLFQSFGFGECFVNGKASGLLSSSTLSNPITYKKKPEISIEANSSILTSEANNQAKKQNETKTKTNPKPKMKPTEIPNLKPKPKKQNKTNLNQFKLNIIKIKIKTNLKLAES